MNDMKESIKVLYVITTFGGGGAESQLFTFVNNSQKHGIEPLVCVLKSSGVIVKRFDNVGIKYKILNTKNPIRHILSIIAIARMENIDVIHAHMFYSGMVARIAGMFCNAKIVITEHGLGVWKKKTMIWADIVSDRLVSKYIAVSKASQKIRKEREKRNPHKIVVIPNGVDSSLLLQSAPDFDSENNIIGCVARLISVKRIDVLLEGMARISAEFDHVTLEIVGDGPCDAELKKLCAQLNIINKVNFLGWRDDVPQLLQRWKLFVLTSEREDCPVSILEAMAAGLPCIAGNTGGIPEIIDNSCGRVFESLDPISLASKIRELIESPSMLKNMSNNCRSKIEKNYLIDVVIKKNRAIYEEIINT